jgi:hypothetical protein
VASAAALAALLFFLVVTPRLAAVACAPSRCTRAGYCLAMADWAATASWNGALRLSVISSAFFHAAPCCDLT